MMNFQTGNILNSSAQCLVNTVNCEGYMGKGIAYQFKEKFPENNKNYVKACKNGSLSIGKILFYSEDEKIIANFPTKDKWREKSEYSYIERGLVELKIGLLERKIKSVAIPPLGCGNGGLDWNKVKQMILEKMSALPLDVIVYEPSKNFTQKTEIPKMSASHLILMKLKDEILPEQFNKFRLQKAAYFLNIFSGTDYFKFEEYKFGPYAHSIEILSQQINSFQNAYNVSTAEAEKILYSNIVSDSVKTTVEKFKYPIHQATEFVNSISSNHELEIAATIVSIVRRNPDFTNDEIINYFLNNWPKYDKTHFTTEEISSSIKKLINSNILVPELMGYSISKKTQLNPLFIPKYQY